MHLDEKTISSESIYDGKIIKVKKDTVLLENDTVAFREVIMHPGGVCIVPITHDDEVIFVRQFRYPYNKQLLEIPAGKLDTGEKPLECGKRELLEETGCTAKQYTFLGELYPTPAYLDEIIYMYMATELSYAEQNLDEDEFLEVEYIPLKKAVNMVLSGEIKDSKTQTALLKAYLLLTGGNSPD